MVSFNAHLPAILAQRSQARFKKSRSTRWLAGLHPERHQLTNLGMKFVYRRIIGLRWITASFGKPRSHILNRSSLPSSNLRRMHAVLFDNSAIVISSQIASSATLALKSGEWFFRFVISNHLFHKLIHLNYWPEIRRARLGCAVPRSAG